MYVVAPVAVKVDEPPLQITVGLADVVKLREETVNVTVRVFVQPTKFVPERFDDTSDWSLTPSGEK